MSCCELMLCDCGPICGICNLFVELVWDLFCCCCSFVLNMIVLLFLSVCFCCRDNYYYTVYYTSLCIYDYVDQLFRRVQLLAVETLR